MPEWGWVGGERALMRRSVEDREEREGRGGRSKLLIYTALMATKDHVTAREISVGQQVLENVHRPD